MASSLERTLREQEAAWEAKPLLRRVYREWHELVASRLSPVEGPTVELGAGLARFREVVHDAVATDVEPTSWAADAVDAARLPYEDESIANLVLIDVFHHLARPARFLDEAGRVLAPGGRVVLLEPYCSPLSTFAYRHFHDEALDLAADPFADAPELAAEPMAANIAVPTLAFFRHAERLRARWPRLALVERRRLSLFLYVLTGGYSRRPLAPAALYRPLALLERLAAPLAPLAAFRCLIVLERARTPRERSLD